MSVDVKVRDLTVDYGDVRALDSVSFDLSAGTIVGLLGRNGSGKTSLVSVLAAFRRASGGETTVGGMAPFENPEAVSRICLIRESGDVADGEKVSSALQFASRHRPDWNQEVADKLLEEFELPLKKRVNTLSRGKRSALGAILGVASRCPLTIFDEVHLGMDAPSRYTFYQALLNDYLEHPRTIILSTHLIEEAASLFEDVLILDRGRLIRHDTADTLREQGTAVVGPAGRVDDFVEGMQVLDRTRLGGTVQATVFGTLDSERRAEAETSGLQLGPVPLQDLFVHLTGSKEES